MTEKDLKLYYFPTSYYSLKVILALYEKEVYFKGQIVNIFTGEQNEDWYLNLNRNGEVPVLEISGEHVMDSDVIIEVIDNTFSTGSKLVPDPRSDVGRRVADMRSMLGAVPVDKITLGSLVHPSLRVDNVKNPLFQRLTRVALDKGLKASIDSLKERRNNISPDMRSAVDRKIELNTRRQEAGVNIEHIREILNDLEQTFDSLEHQIQQTKRELGVGAQCWLCGPNFTAADITATMLMFRLDMVGLAPQYFSKQTRPEVYAYYQSLAKRESVVKMMKMSDSVVTYLKYQAVKSYLKTALKIGAIAGLFVIGYAGYRKLSKSSIGRLFKA